MERGDLAKCLLGLNEFQRYAAVNLTFFFSFFFPHKKKKKKGPVPVVLADAPPPPGAPVRPAGVRYASGDPDVDLNRPQIAVTAKPVLTANGLGVTLSVGTKGRSKRSEHATYAFLTGVFYLAIGIACLVIAGPRRVVSCGQGGSPALLNWVYATGIAYTIIAGAMFFIWILLRTGDNRDSKTISFHPDSKLSILISFFVFLIINISYSFAFFSSDLPVFCIHRRLDHCGRRQSLERRRRLRVFGFRTLANGHGSRYSFHHPRCDLPFGTRHLQLSQKRARARH